MLALTGILSSVAEHHIANARGRRLVDNRIVRFLLYFSIHVVGSATLFDAPVCTVCCLVGSIYTDRFPHGLGGALPLPCMAALPL